MSISPPAHPRLDLPPEVAAVFREFRTCEIKAAVVREERGRRA